MVVLLNIFILLLNLFYFSTFVCISRKLVVDRNVNYNQHSFHLRDTTTNIVCTLMKINMLKYIARMKTMVEKVHLSSCH